YYNFDSTLSQASNANSNGFWLSIVADYGKGYTALDSNVINFIWNWAEQLCQEILTGKYFKKNSNDVYAELSYPKDINFPILFRVKYTNNGVVTIQWRGSTSEIYLDWVVALCLDALVQIFNSPVVNGLRPLNIGFALSNAPEGGISTSILFPSTAADNYRKGLSIQWASHIDDSKKIDDYIRDFVGHTLLSWGYLDYEESLSSLLLNTARTEFRMRQDKKKLY
ncbi:MAG: hypothetical protein K0Q73_8336, partial [Paenibacillus sp.]|nr:hypothetical protein [Paenibacillus sp.]